MERDHEDDAYLTTGAAARRLHISKMTLLRALRRGEIAPTFRTPSGVHGDVELTHLRQDNMTLLFQAVRTWRVLSSLVDAERRGRQAGSRGVKLTWRSLGQISLALTAGTPGSTSPTWIATPASSPAAGRPENGSPLC